MSETERDLAPIPYGHPVAVAHLSREAETPFDIAPGAEDLPAIATYLGVDLAAEIRLAGQIAPISGNGWQVIATVTGALTQPCIVTLDPVTQRIEEAVARRYVPMAEAVATTEIIVDHDDDSPDPLGEHIDLGALLLEELALHIDPYPRAENATLETRIFAAPGVAPMTDEDARPFAKLAALKDKLGGGE